MVVFSLLTAAIAPGVALLVYFYLKDRYESEPIASVAKMFVIGLLIVFPIMVVQRGFVLGFGENPFFFAFGISAGIEEFVKWFLVYFLIYRNKSIRHSYDGIVYATAVSLGFATMENVLFSVFYNPDIPMLISRALLPVSGHALFGVIMGYYFGRARYDIFTEQRNIRMALLFPILWHGMFDYILLWGKEWLWMIVPFMVLLWYRGIRKVNLASGMPILKPSAPNDKVKISANGQ